MELISVSMQILRVRFNFAEMSSYKNYQKTHASEACKNGLNWSK